jgi:hypothetical protein
LIVSDPYFVYMATLLATMVLSISLIVAPFVFPGDGRNLVGRVVVFLIALGCCFAMRRAGGRLALDDYGSYWPSVTTGAACMTVVVAGFVTAMGVVRLLCTPLDSVRRGRQFEESSGQDGDYDEGYSRWDRDYREKRRR